MGDIKSRPKTPAPQAFYVPQYIYTNTQTPSGSTPPDSGTPQVKEPDLTPQEQREKSLLGRTRSRVGTVLTSFRGILSASEPSNQRKILLGE